MLFKREKLDYFSHLPDEITCKILLRLPSKPLFKCTAVCKSWSYMIQNSTFINTHISRTICPNNQNDDDQLLLIQAYPDKEWRYEGLFSLHLDNPPFSEHTKLISPYPSVPYKRRNVDLVVNVLGTCNGIVCLIHRQFGQKDAIVIWNPCIRRFVDLPDPRIGNLELEKWDLKNYGFGYDSSTNDYKVLIISISTNSCDIQIWSLTTGLWKSLSDDVIPANFRPRIDVYTGVARCFVNGALHGIQYGEERFIWSFDMSSELFGEIKIPEALRKGKIFDIASYKHSLAFFERYQEAHHHQQINVWVMKEYGVLESCTKLFTIPWTMNPSYLWPLGFIKSGELVLKYFHPNAKSEVKLVDPETNEVSDFEINEYCRCCSLHNFAESLVLLGNPHAIPY